MAYIIIHVLATYAKSGLALHTNKESGMANATPATPLPLPLMHNSSTGAHAKGTRYHDVIACVK